MALLIQISSDLPNVKSNLICTVSASGHFDAADLGNQTCANSEVLIMSVMPTEV